MIDTDGKIVGFAVSGQSRPDVALALGERAKNSGFKGYLLSEKQGRSVFAVGEDPKCRLSSNVPVLPFKVLQFSNPASGVSVSKASIPKGNEWIGTVFAKSNISGMVVLGSFIHSDADVGSSGFVFN
jgi:hypothetical protein